MTAPAGWTVADVRRAMKAARAGGLPLAAVDFPPQGGFRLLFGERIDVDLKTGSGANEWDDVLAS